MQKYKIVLPFVSGGPPRADNSQLGLQGLGAGVELGQLIAVLPFPLAAASPVRSGHSELAATAIPLRLSRLKKLLRVIIGGLSPLLPNGHQSAAE